MIKGNFTGNWLNYWTPILLDEPITPDVVGYGEVPVEVLHFKHDEQLQATWIEGVEQVEEGCKPKMSKDGKVFGAIFWRVDLHIMHPAPPPIPVEEPKVILAPWIAREASQYT